MLECCKSAGVAVTFTRLVDSMSMLLDRRRKSSTHQFGYNNEGMENPQIGLWISPDELDLFDPVIRPQKHHCNHGIKEGMDHLRSFVI